MTNESNLQHVIIAGTILSLLELVNDEESHVGDIVSARHILTEFGIKLNDKK